MHSISNKKIMLYLFYWRGLVVYHRRHPSSSFVVVSCCPCPRRILILFTSSHILTIIVVVVIVIPVRRRRLVLSRSIGVSLSYSFVISLQHIGILASCTRGPRRTSSEVSCTSGDLEALCTSTLTTICIWDASKVASVCKWEESAEYFPGFKTIYKQELAQREVTKCGSTLTYIFCFIGSLYVKTYHNKIIFCFIGSLYVERIITK